MPQLDFTPAFPQIFWLILIFFSFYTIIVHFFLPNFIKLTKSRKLVVLENNKILLTIQNKFNLKQKFLNENLNRDFEKIKIMLEKQISTFFSTTNFYDLNSIDIKISKTLYENTLYYDTNVLKTIPLKPMVFNSRNK